MQMTFSELQRRPDPSPQLGSTFLCEPPRRLELASGFTFDHGARIAPFSIVYETFGTLAADRNNAILVCHALSPGAHAAGKYTATDAAAGWWDGLIGQIG